VGFAARNLRYFVNSCRRLSWNAEMNIQTPRKNTIHFVFNKDTAKNLLSIFNKKSGAIFSGRQQIKEVDFFEADDDYIKITGRMSKKITMYLSAETFRHGVWMLEYYLLNSYFNVAEFCELEVIENQENPSGVVVNPKNRHMVQIYFLNEDEPARVG